MKCALEVLAERKAYVEMKTKELEERLEEYKKETRKNTIKFIEKYLPQTIDEMIKTDISTDICKQLWFLYSSDYKFSKHVDIILHRYEYYFSTETGRIDINYLKEYLKKYCFELYCHSNPIGGSCIRLAIGIDVECLK